MGGGDLNLTQFKKQDFNALNDDEKSEGFIFHILTDKTNSQNKLKALEQDLKQIYPCEIRVHICDDTKFQGLPKWGGNYLAYYRLFIPELMPSNLKSCLYLDVDMLVFKDLRELFTLNLENKVAGVILDVANTKHWVNTHLNLSFDFYFNSGFLLLNLEEFKRQDMQKCCADLLLSYENYIGSCPDQDILNMAMKDKILILPVKFNLFPHAYDERADREFEYSKQEIKSACLNPVILHFADNSKPWIFNLNYIRKDLATNLSLLWWQMAFQTPIFKGELLEKLQEMFLIYDEMKEEYFIRKEFPNYLGLMMLKQSQNFFTFLKMPFVVRSIFKQKRRNKLNLATMQKLKTPLNKEELVKEFAHFATRAYNRRKELKLLFLPYKIYTLKKRWEKRQKAIKS